MLKSGSGRRVPADMKIEFNDIPKQYRDVCFGSQPFFKAPWISHFEVANAVNRSLYVEVKGPVRWMGPIL